MKSRLQLISVFGGFLLGAGTLYAATLSNVQVAAQNSGHEVGITFELTDGPAIVTVEAGTLTNGVFTPFTVTNAGAFSGDVSTVITNTAAGSAVWHVPAFLPAAVAEVAFRVKAWPTNNTPDYLAIALGGMNDSSAPFEIAYYPSAATLPGGDAIRTGILALRRIPHGTFTMGSPTTEPFHEQAQKNISWLSGMMGKETQHAVTLTKDFYMGVFELTQGQWWQVCNTNKTAYYNAPVSDSFTRPMEQMGWNGMRGAGAGRTNLTHAGVQANSFLGLLTARTGLAFDVPTEAEWEYACRAGTTNSLNNGTDVAADSSWTNDANMELLGRYQFNGGRVFNGGIWADNANWSLYLNGVSAVYATARAGSFLPNAWGLYDMHGNVNEYCRDVFVSDLGANAQTNPVKTAGISTTAQHVRRGGGYYFEASMARAACRVSFALEDNNGTGFRVAAYPPLVDDAAAAVAEVLTSPVATTVLAVSPAMPVLGATVDGVTADLRTEVWELSNEVNADTRPPKGTCYLFK